MGLALWRSQGHSAVVLIVLESDTEIPQLLVYVRPVVILECSLLELWFS